MYKKNSFDLYDHFFVLFRSILTNLKSSEVNHKLLKVGHLYHIVSFKIEIEPSQCIKCSMTCFVLSNINEELKNKNIIKFHQAFKLYFAEIKKYMINEMLKI